MKKINTNKKCIMSLLFDCFSILANKWMQTGSKYNKNYNKIKVHAVKNLMGADRTILHSPISL